MYRITSNLHFLSRNAYLFLIYIMLVCSYCTQLSKSFKHRCCMRLLNSAVNHHSQPHSFPVSSLVTVFFSASIPNPSLSQPPIPTLVILQLTLTAVTDLSPSAKPLKSSSRMRRILTSEGYENFSFGLMMLEEKVK